MTSSGGGSNPLSSGSSGGVDTSSDVALPKALTDFVFDLYDSVTTSQLSDEQHLLYNGQFRDLSNKYFTNQAWPSPQSIASECNGDPLFLAIYREMTHRHWHQVVITRPTLRDRMEGFQVYRELFDEILEVAAEHTPGEDEDASFFLLPSWVFDIFHEFGYQFQGFCQVRSAVYSSARKHGFVTTVHPETGRTMTVSSASVGAGAATTATGGAGTAAATSGSGGTPASGTSSTASSNLLDNLTLLENNPDAWDVEIVFHYLHRFAELGLPRSLPSSGGGGTPIVYTYFGVFATITKSRLECLLGDFTSCLQALTPLTLYGNRPILAPKDGQQIHGSDGTDTTTATGGRTTTTITETIHSVLAAHANMSYHAGISLLMLRRYKDAVLVLNGICVTLLRGFKTGQFLSAAQQQRNNNNNNTSNNNKLVNLASSDQLYKQLERMLSILALIQFVLFFGSGGGNTNHNNSASNYKKSGGSNSTTTMDLLDDAVWRAIREKHGTRLEAMAISSAASAAASAVAAVYNSSNNANQQQQQPRNNNNNNNNAAAALAYEEWFASPKFITTNPHHIPASFHRQVVHSFLLREFGSGVSSIGNRGGGGGNDETAATAASTALYRTVRSYLQLYTTLSVTKLTNYFYYNNDVNHNNNNNDKDSNNNNNTQPLGTGTNSNAQDIIPLLLAYKLRYYQMETRTPQEPLYRDTLTTTTTTTGGGSTSSFSLLGSSTSSSSTNNKNPTLEEPAVAVEAAAEAVDWKDVFMNDLHFYIEDSTIYVDDDGVEDEDEQSSSPPQPLGGGKEDHHTTADKTKHATGSTTTTKPIGSSSSHALLPRRPRCRRGAGGGGGIQYEKYFLNRLEQNIEILQAATLLDPTDI